MCIHSTGADLSLSAMVTKGFDPEVNSAAIKHFRDPRYSAHKALIHYYPVKLVVVVFFNVLYT
jgi:hypothetical protein